MSLSASTCLTYTGTTPLGQTLYVFSNVDAYSTYFTTIPLSAITGNNCPYLITGIPDGTTSIRLQDYATGCCVTIPIQCSSDFCNTCDLDFTLLSASTVSQIVAGNLTGSCENITDYVIYWYGPNSTTEVGYVSGFGNEFDYQFTHPLTGTSAIFAQGGTYIPVIDKVIISGYTFSQTGGTGYIANLNCFDPISVESLKCDNGNQPSSAYTHFFQYSGATSGVLPQPLSVSFELSANTAFFAMTFQGFSISDRIDITLNSVNYSVPIYLESAVIGTDAGGPNIDSFPRLLPYNTQVPKVICLTGFTISNGDYLNIEITPNTANTATNWALKMTCLDEFNCDSCFETATTPFKIFPSSVTAITATCGQVVVQFSVSGCNSASVITGDTWTYLMNGSPSSSGRVFDSDGVIPITTVSLYFTNLSCNSVFGNSVPICSTPNSNTIIYEKGIVGATSYLKITCNSFSDFTFFDTAYNNALSSYTITSDPLSLNYYRAVTLRYPTPLGTTNCGDGTTDNYIDIHTSSVVTTGGTGPWYINFTLPTITPSISFTTCELNCQSGLNTIVNAINNSSTGTSNNFTGTTTTGSKYTIPFVTRYRLTSGNTVNSATTYNGQNYTIPYTFKTIPWSGVGNTYIPSLSGATCNQDYFDCQGINCNQFFYYYNIILTNPSNPKDFDILGSPITNFKYSGYPSTVISELALRFSGGTITYSNPTYIL
jgi:hypothetical protein